MKRIISIIVVLLIVLSSFGCSDGAKKNQYIYVEESAQYGDLKITFLEYELKHMSAGTYPRIHLLITNNGNDRYVINASSFVVYGDGVDLGHCDSSYPWTDGRAGNCTNDRLELQPERSGEIWINHTRRHIDDLDLIEFDYVYSPYAERWGKITFAINLYDGKHNQTDSSKSLELDKAIIGTWQFMDTKHEYADNYYEAYTFFDDNTGIYQLVNSTYNFTYYFDGDDLYVDSKYKGQCECDRDYLTLVYWFGNVATRYYYEKIEDLQTNSNESFDLIKVEDNQNGSDESFDLAKAIIGTWQLEAMTTGDFDHYLVSISICDDDTCLCKYNDGSSEHFLYELLELIDGNTLWLYNDSRYIDYEMQFADEYLFLSPYDSLGNQSFKGMYAKEAESIGYGAYWGVEGG